MSILVLAQFVLNRFKSDYIRIDNSIFRLHYRNTFAILVSCSLVFYWNWGLRDIIDCIGDSKDLNDELLDEYCKIEGAYTTFPRCRKQEIGVHTLGSYVTGTNEGDPEIGHKTYQWLGMIFFVQALLFYFPRYLWKTLEDGHLKLLISDLTEPVLIKESVSGKIKQLVDYLVGNMGNYQFYFARYVLCELLNLVNLMSQIIVLDRYFGFLSFGPALVKFITEVDLDGFDKGSRVPKQIIEGLSFTMTVTEGLNGRSSQETYCYDSATPLELHFATLTKCKFAKYGPSGQLQTHDAVCVLWLNALNQRIFMFLWFWFITLFVFTLIASCYRAVTVVSRRSRQALLSSKYPSNKNGDLAILSHSLNAGDWFILHLLSKNLDGEVAQDVITCLLERLGIDSKNVKHSQSVT